MSLYEKVIAVYGRLTALLSGKRDKTDNFTIYGDAQDEWEIFGDADHTLSSNGKYVYESEGVWRLVERDNRIIRRVADGSSDESGSDEGDLYELVVDPGNPDREESVAKFVGITDHLNVTITYKSPDAPQSDPIVITGVHIKGYATGDTLARKSRVEQVDAAVQSLSSVVNTKADKSEVAPLQFAAWYPDGSVTSEADFTQGIKFTYDANTLTASVLPFSNTGDPDADNSGLRGRVVIPPYVEHEGSRYTVTSISGTPSSPGYGHGPSSVVSPTTVARLDAGALFGCRSLVSASFPGVTTVEGSVFFGCESLVSVTMPAAETFLHSGVFQYTSLKSLLLPAATSISRSMADAEALEYVSLPSVAGIENRAFEGCRSLKAVDFGDTPRAVVPPLGDGAFYNVPTTCKIVVPDAQYDAWTAPNDGWSAVKLAADARALDTRGTLVYAYARGNYTANGIAFTASPENVGIDNANCTVDITHGASNTPPEDVEAGGYRDILSGGWYASAATRTVTLRNLVEGHRYIVQIVMSRSDYTSQSAEVGDVIAKFGGLGWEHGGSLVGIVTAGAGTTVALAVKFTGNSWINAIQVRDLGPAPGTDGRNPWYDLVQQGYGFLKHSEWEPAHRYEVDRARLVYAECATDQSIADKEAMTPKGDFVAEEGRVAAIHFARFCAGGNPTLSIDGSTRQQIYQRLEGDGTKYPAGEWAWSSGDVVFLRLYSWGWLIVSHGPADTNTMGVSRLADNVTGDDSHAAVNQRAVRVAFENAKSYTDVAVSRAKPTHIYDETGKEGLDDKGGLHTGVLGDSYYIFGSGIKFSWEGYRFVVALNKNAYAYKEQDANNYVVYDRDDGYIYNVWWESQTQTWKKNEIGKTSAGLYPEDGAVLPDIGNAAIAGHGTGSLWFIPQETVLAPTPYAQFALESVPSRVIEASTAYEVGDVLGDNGNAYRCIRAYTSASEPIPPHSDETNWRNVPVLASIVSDKRDYADFSCYKRGYPAKGEGWFVVTKPDGTVETWKAFHQDTIYGWSKTGTYVPPPYIMRSDFDYRVDFGGGISGIHILSPETKNAVNLVTYNDETWKFEGFDGTKNGVLAQTSEIPEVIAPSTEEAASGSAADAKSTGDALQQMTEAIGQKIAKSGGTAEDITFGASNGPVIVQHGSADATLEFIDLASDYTVSLKVSPGGQIAILSGNITENHVPKFDRYGRLIDSGKSLDDKSDAFSINYSSGLRMDKMDLYAFLLNNNTLLYTESIPEEYEEAGLFEITDRRWVTSDNYVTKQEGKFLFHQTYEGHDRYTEVIRAEASDLLNRDVLTGANLAGQEFNLSTEEGLKDALRAVIETLGGTAV